MSKADILAELPRLKLDERQEIFERLCELEEAALLQNPSRAEKEILDKELEEYQRDPQPGSTWTEVNKRLRNSAL